MKISLISFTPPFSLTTFMSISPTYSPFVNILSYDNHEDSKVFHYELWKDVVSYIFRVVVVLLLLFRVGTNLINLFRKILMILLFL